MLVHIEREDRDSPGHGLAVLRCVLIDQPAIARQVAEQHPPRTARERVRHGDELAAPAIRRAEVAGEGLGQRLGRLALAAEAGEIDFMQECGIERHQLLALEAVDDVARRLGEIQRLQLLGNGVEAPQRSAIVVLVVALDQLGRKAV